MDELECPCIIEELLEQGFGSRNYNSKMDIINKGRPTPSLKSLVKETKSCVRHFNQEWYLKDPWLCGCKKLCALFCWPCLLFSNESTVWTTKGMSDISRYHVLKKRHELTQAHISSKISLQKFGNTRVEECSSLAFKINCEKHNERVRNNRYIVSCLIDAVCFLAEQELSFREHCENNESDNRRNYVQLLNHRARFDERLRNHFESSSVFIGTSHEIQNELIDAVSTIVMNKIKEEVQEAPYVSIIVDEATDINHKSQLSCALRYVTPGGIQERFIKFVDVSGDQSANTLTNLVFEFISEFECDKKLVAQTYDGCSVMAGVHKALQKLITGKYQSALFVHCYAHKLNLVLQQSVKCIKECKVFFETLHGFSSFFSRSSKRKAAYDTVCQKHLPSFAPARWIYVERLVETVSECKDDLIQFFDSVANDTNEWDGETRACCRGFCSILKDFDFNFLLSLFSAVLPQSKMLFNILPTEMNDIKYCSNKVREYINFLTKKRHSFEDFWQKECQSGSCEAEVPSKRQRISLVNNDKQESYRRLYLEVIDTMIIHLNDRFSSIEKLEFLSLLDQSSFETYSTAFPRKAYESLISSYGSHFNTSVLQSELSVIYGSEEFKKTSTLELYTYLTMTGLNSALPEVTKLCALVLTIPATTPSVEGSFSGMKRIHTYLRNAQTQGGITKLALLAIEKDLLKTLEKSPTFHDSVIDIFATKDRHLELTYKL